MLHHICAYMFEGKDADFDEQNLNVIWSDLKDILALQRKTCSEGKGTTKYDRLWKHFAFLKSYFDKLRLMNLNEGGTYIRALCEQAFEGKIAKDLPAKAAKFYTLSRLTLDASLERKKSGAKGGRSRTRSKDIPASKKRTIEDLKALGCTGNLNPENPVLDGVDIDKLYAVANATYEISVVSYTYGAKGAHNVERTILPK